MNRLKKIVLIALVSLTSFGYSAIQWKSGDRAFSAEVTELLEKRYQEYVKGLNICWFKTTIDGKYCKIDFGVMKQIIYTTNGDLPQDLRLTREIVNAPEDDCRNQAFWDKLMG